MAHSLNTMNGNEYHDFKLKGYCSLITSLNSCKRSIHIILRDKKSKKNENHITYNEIKTIFPEFYIEDLVTETKGRW